jgi:CRP-like cAMP-binding protein
MNTHSINSFIQSIFTLPNTVLQELLGKLNLLELPANSYLLKEGNTCNVIWFIQKGLVKHFYVDEKGKERITWFAAEDTITTEMFSLFNNQPSKENIQLIEDAIIYAISYTDIVQLQNKYHQFCIWYIRMIECFHFNQVDKRITELQFLDATQRYQALLQQNPTFIQRISLGSIASYLNISQETLSRIRAKR